MIFFFKRMTLGLSYQRLVNYIGYACVIAYTAVVLTVGGLCRPWNLSARETDTSSRSRLAAGPFITTTSE